MSTPVKKKVRIWDMCLRLIQMYKERIPDVREIIDDSTWRRIIFPNGSRAHFKTARRDSNFAICVTWSPNDGFFDMELFNEKDIVKARNKINKLIKE